MYKFTEDQLIKLLKKHTNLVEECISQCNHYNGQQTVDDIICDLEEERELVDTGAMEQATMQIYCAKQLEPKILDNLVEHSGKLADIAARERYPGQLNEIRLRADVLAINLLDEQRRLSSRTTRGADHAAAPEK
jgi:hypothetical protein